MSLTTLFKGKKVKKDLGYGKSVTLVIEDIKENIHRYNDQTVAFKNYSINFTNGESEIFKSLDDINFTR